MTIGEFKAWLEGLEAGFTGTAPTAEQFAAIKAKLAIVEAEKKPMPVYRGAFDNGPRWGIPA